MWKTSQVKNEKYYKKHIGWKKDEKIGLIGFGFTKLKDNTENPSPDPFFRPRMWDHEA